jgi:hypothetical protein
MPALPYCRDLAIETRTDTDLEHDTFRNKTEAFKYLLRVVRYLFSTKVMLRVPVLVPNNLDKNINTTPLGLALGRKVALLYTSRF